jgi:UDP-3-O-[3-hydroxymyristoyl] glucosamine N-acyltransferase
MTAISVRDLAKSIDATIYGNDDVLVEKLCSLDEQQPKGIAFSKSSKLSEIVSLLATSKLSALLVSKEVNVEQLSPESLPENFCFLQVDNPIAAMVGVMPMLHRSVPLERSIHPSSDIAASASIGENVHIGAFCSIGENCVIKDNATLYPGVVLYPEVHIGENTILHSGACVRERCHLGAGSLIQNGAVIGADGFGYFPTPTGLKAVPQIGIVRMEDNADVGANTCIDRATLGSTQIGLGVKIDNLVQVGHNVQIGDHSIVCGDVAIGGSTKIGKGVTLAGASSYADHIEIEDGARFSGRSAAGHMSHYKKDDYMGYPAQSAGDWKKIQIASRKLPELLKRVRRLERQLNDD